MMSNTMNSACYCIERMWVLRTILGSDKCEITQWVEGKEVNA